MSFVRARRFGPKKLTGASGFSGLALPKTSALSPSLAQWAEDMHARELAQIRKTRDYVANRDRRCTVCHGDRREARVFQLEMNEIVPRSATRGMAPEERFNRHNCHMVCRACHQDITENRIAVTGDPDVPEKFGGGLTIHAGSKAASGGRRGRVQAV